MSDEQAADLERRARAGEWLRPSDVATLLGVNRRTVDRLLRAESGGLSYRVKPGTGRHREINPGDVLAELDRRRTVHGRADESAPPAR